MPKNLIELIKASGGAGISGQSFANNVTGAASGVRMTDYLIPSWNIDSSTIPIDGLGVIYSSGHVFNIDIAITRGSRANLIQRLTSTAFTPFLLPMGIGGGVGSYAEVQSLSVFGGGSQFIVGVQVFGELSGTASVGINNEFVNENPAIDTGVASHTVRYFAIINTGGGGQQTSTRYQLSIDYDPDIANFNPVLTSKDFITDAGWAFDMYDRTYQLSELQFRWWDNQTDANNQNTSTIRSTQSAVFAEAYPNGSGQFEGTIYMRWKRPVDSVWSAVISNTYISSTTPLPPA
jgi:hypothetical protein